MVKEELDQLRKDGSPGVHPALPLLGEMPPSTLLASCRISNRFCSKTQVSRSI
jgi:hypothetical protein